MVEAEVEVVSIKQPQPEPPASRREAHRRGETSWYRLKRESVALRTVIDEANDARRALGKRPLPRARIRSLYRELEDELSSLVIIRPKAIDPHSPSHRILNFRVLDQDRDHARERLVQIEEIPTATRTGEEASAYCKNVFYPRLKDGFDGEIPTRDQVWKWARDLAYRAFTGRGMPPDEADRLAHEAILKLADYLDGRRDGSNGEFLDFPSLRKFITGTAINLWRDHWREKAKAPVEVEFHEDLVEVEEGGSRIPRACQSGSHSFSRPLERRFVQSQEDQDQADVRRLLPRLTPTQRAVVEIRLNDSDLSWKEIASKLSEREGKEVSSGAAKSRFRRAKDALRRLLEEQDKREVSSKKAN